jgi:carboxymethylenebutenolidase
MNMHRLPTDAIGLSKVMPPLSRRGFMTSSAATAAGYTLAAGPVRADAIRTDSKGLDAGMTKVKVPDGEMPAYYARPEGVANPPIILVAMEIFGLHEYIKDVTRRLGHLGALAIAPDYYFRVEEKNGIDLTKITDIPKLLPLVNSKTDTELFSDLDATAAWAKSQGGDGNRLGIMGFCRGGRTVWHYSSHNPDLNGADDAGIKLDQVAQMEEALKAANKTFEFIVYSGAPHGFHADYRPSYRKDAAEDAWNQLIHWYKKYGVLS